MRRSKLGNHLIRFVNNVVIHNRGTKLENLLAMLTFDRFGIFCAPAGVYIDPWKPVDRAIITHAHSDHARWGSKHYLAHQQSIPVLKYRLGQEIQAQGVAYGEKMNINGVTISLHPAGHIIGSAQVRLEYKGEVWVAIYAKWLREEYKLNAVEVDTLYEGESIEESTPETEQERVEE
jgi:putative mRNA 3-end processing factor